MARKSGNRHSDEFGDAVRHHESENEGLGHRFRENVKKAAVRSSEYPKV